MQHATFIILLLIIHLASCKSTEHQIENKSTDECILTTELKEVIQFKEVKLAKAKNEINLTGSVSYNQNSIYRYQPLVNGIVTKVNFNLGDFITKGQVLAEIRSTELSDQKSVLNIAIASLNLAERNLKSVVNLHKNGLASDKDLLEAQNELNRANSELQRINESISIYGGNLDAGVLVVKAPLSGYIVEKKITEGYQINAGEESLFVISDLTKIWILANVYTAQLGKIYPGEEVEIRTTAYPDKVFEGKIARLSNVFDPEEKVMKAIIELENKDLLLKPDMVVSVSVFELAEEEAIALPVADVIFDKDAYHVVKYLNDCEAINLTIQPFAHDRKYYYLKKENGLLNVGDTMITQNHLLIYNQLKGI